MNGQKYSSINLLTFYFNSLYDECNSSWNWFKILPRYTSFQKCIIKITIKKIYPPRKNISRFEAIIQWSNLFFDRSWLIEKIFSNRTFARHWATRERSTVKPWTYRYNNSYDKYSIANFISTLAIFLCSLICSRLRMTRRIVKSVPYFKKITRLDVTFRRWATSEIDVPVKASRFRQKSNPKDCYVHQLTASFQLVTD